MSAGRNHAADGIPLGGGRQDDGGPAPKGPEEGAGGDAEKALPAHPPPGKTDIIRRRAKLFDIGIGSFLIAASI